MVQTVIMMMMWTQYDTPVTLSSAVAGPNVATPIAIVCKMERCVT